MLDFPDGYVGEGLAYGISVCAPTPLPRDDPKGRHRTGEGKHANSMQKQNNELLRYVCNSSGLRASCSNFA